MSCTFDYLNVEFVSRFIMFAMFIGGFLVPVIIITFSYSLILLRLKQRRNMLSLNDETDSKPSASVANDIESTQETTETGKMVGSGGVKRMNTVTKNEQEKLKSSFIRSEIKATKTAILSVICFICAWLPYASICILAQLSSQREEYVTPHSTSLPAMFAKSSAMYNPIIYVFTNRKFQSAIKKLLPFTEVIIREPSRSTGSDIHRVKFSANETYVAIQTNAQTSA